MKIDHIVARQILDSRGNPTVEADVWLEGNVMGRAAVPSGASTGSHEACELRDGGSEFLGKSVHKAVENIDSQIQKRLLGMKADDQSAVDRAMIELDGSENKQQLGANAILAVSLAVAHAAAKARGILLYSHINDLAGNPQKSLPMPMMNVLNGGKHANHSTDIQEFMIIPYAATTMNQAVRIGAEVFSSLRAELQKKGLSVAVGDEGGFTVPVEHANHEALDVLLQAVTEAGYVPGEDVVFALDVAAAELHQDGLYQLRAEDKQLSSTQMIDYLKELKARYPIVSIEDGLGEDDWDGWRSLGEQIDDCQLVGDDLLVTNIDRLNQAIAAHAGNAILIKPNQIGTLSETMKTIARAREAGWNTVVSHRSGETEDITIVHIAIGTGAGQIKTGSLSRGERTAKYNELMRISEIDPELSLNNPF